MPKKRFQVEPRASEKYPWQVVDLGVNRDGVMSIHRTKREADTALYELRKGMRQQARIDRVWAAQRTALQGREQ